MLTKALKQTSCWGGGQGLKRGGKLDKETSLPGTQVVAGKDVGGRRASERRVFPEFCSCDRQKGIIGTLKLQPAPPTPKAPINTRLRHHTIFHTLPKHTTGKAQGASSSPETCITQSFGGAHKLRVFKLLAARTQTCAKQPFC